MSDRWVPCKPAMYVEQLSASDNVHMQIVAASTLSGDASPWQSGAPCQRLQGMPGYNDVPYGAPPGMNHAVTKGTSRCVLPAGWEAVMGSGSTGTTTGPPITRCEFTSDSAGHATEANKTIGGVGKSQALEDALDALYRHQASCQSISCTLSGK
jgi:hypothetical protein